MITERPWVIGGLISAGTTVAVFGLIAVTQPGNVGPPAKDQSSVIVAASAVPLAPTPNPTGLTGTISKPTKVSTVRSVPVKITKAAKPKVTKAKATTKAAPKTAARTGSRPGTGRIQFGKTYKGKATFYGATGAGNCSFEASSDLMVGAMNQADYENSQACGAYLSVTGPNGKVTIRIVDRCPECPVGAIDLSQQAFAKIAPVSAGRVSISWHLLSPAKLGPIAYRYKTGSSQYWCGIQVRNHRNPVRTVQVKSGGSWKTLERQDYNYFLSNDGAGCGGTIRVTDIYGNRVTDTGIRIAPDQTQQGKAQFPAA